MRLIDADKLQAKHFLQRSEYPIGYEGTQPIYKYIDVLAYDIESAEIVEAIPIKWIGEYLAGIDSETKYAEQRIIQYMVEKWRNENEIN